MRRSPTDRRSLRGDSRRPSDRRCRRRSRRSGFRDRRAPGPCTAQDSPPGRPRSVEVAEPIGQRGVATTLSYPLGRSHPALAASMQPPRPSRASGFVSQDHILPDVDSPEATRRGRGQASAAPWIERNSRREPRFGRGSGTVPGRPRLGFSRVSPAVRHTAVRRFQPSSPSDHGTALPRLNTRSCPSSPGRRPDRSPTLSIVEVYTITGENGTLRRRDWRLYDS